MEIYVTFYYKNGATQNLRMSNQAYSYITNSTANLSKNKKIAKVLMDIMYDLKATHFDFEILEA
jgi:hypothetical protein